MDLTAPAQRLARGAAAGAVATLPMSAVMLAAGRLGLMGEQPPEAITEQAVEDTTGEPPRGTASHALSSAAHLLFGAGGGALFAVLPRPARVPATWSGIGFALAVYTSAYLGWVPRTGALPHADDDRDDRVAAMVLAHVVYGAALGALVQRWTR